MLEVFFFFSFWLWGEKSCCDNGKTRYQAYLITAIQAHTGLCCVASVVSSPVSPALSSLSTEATRSHTFVPLPQSLSQPFSVVGKNHKPHQGNRYERHKQLYQSPPCNYLQHLLDTHRRSAVGLFHGSSRDMKTYYQSNFPLSPWAKQSVWETHALFILTTREPERGERLWLSREWESRLRGADVASFHNLFCLINNVAWNQ